MINAWIHPVLTAIAFAGAGFFFTLSAIQFFRQRRQKK